MSDHEYEIKPGQKLLLDIQDLAHEGQGVGKIDGLVIFVEGALKGETVLAEIHKVAKKYAIAKTLSVVKRSPDRIEPECANALLCGGCMLQHLSYKGQLQFKTQKVKDSLQRIGHIDTKVLDTIGMTVPRQYRNKAQYPIGKQNGHSVMGFYEKGSHIIVPMTDCMIQHPSSAKAARIIKQWLDRFHISIYNEEKHEGLVRHLVTKISFATGEMMIVLVINGRNIPHSKELIGMLRNRLPEFKSLMLNVNTAKTNIIMGKQNINLFGSPYIHDYIGNVKFALSPQTFFQVNPVQVKVLYDKVLEFARLSRQETVIDTYCGIGTISLFISHKARKVFGIELVPQSVRDARHNAKINGIQNVEFLEGASEDVMPQLLEKGIKADVIIMDPPRRGCDQKFLNAVSKMNPERIIYVSCNPATLARDLRFLSDLGFKANTVQPVDMFPYTGHVECVVLMSRVEK